MEENNMELRDIISKTKLRSLSAMHRKRRLRANLSVFLEAIPGAVLAPLQFCTGQEKSS